MGKRKKSSRKPQGPRKREPLATTFKCLFCNHEKAIQVKLDKRTEIGTLTCKVCGQRFRSKVNYLSAPVDVYSDWVDACEAVAEQQADSELRNPNKATAEDMNFSTYGAGGDDRRAGAAADGDADLMNDDDLLNDDNY